LKSTLIKFSLFLLTVSALLKLIFEELPNFMFLEGLSKATKDIRKVIEIIQDSENSAEAKSQLIDKFFLSEKQANSVLDMPLKKLTALEKSQIDDDIKKLQERICEVDLLFPKEYLGAILTLLNDKRGIQEDLTYLSTTMVKLKYKLPLLELVSGFYDSLKSISQGFASIDYKILGFEDGSLVKLDILVNGMVVDSFSSILSKDSAEYVGRNRVKKLADLIPRQQFDIPIQAAIGSRIISRETVKALRKDVTAKLYGGDVTRKRKLLEKQKEGKKKMRSIGRVEVPKEAFKEFLKQ